MVRRGLLAICLLAAGAAAFRRRRFQPNWSFRRSADWVIARTPTRYGDALRTIRKCMDCDALEVSLQNHSISLTNATLSLDDEEALRVERLEVVVESYSPLIVSASLGTVRVSVECARPAPAGHELAPPERARRGIHATIPVVVVSYVVVLVVVALGRPAPRLLRGSRAAVDAEPIAGRRRQSRLGDS